jgi:hypothetical protein
MKYARPLVIAAVAGSLVTAGAANASTSHPNKKKPKPVCNLVTDAPGDANGIGSQLTVEGQGVPPAENAGPSDDNFDIVSADVASSATTVTGVIRVKGLSATDSNSPTGGSWQINFDAGGTTFELLASTNPQGTPTYQAAYQSTTGGSLYPTTGITGVFNTAKHEIHISAPLSVLGAQVKITAGMVFTNISADAGQSAAIPDSAGAFGGGSIFTDSNAADTASTTKAYKAGTRSCVTPGK